MDNSRTAVVIEDDKDIRELICGVLRQSGFNVYSAETGASGVETVREHQPDVVTLDLGLPDIDGFEVARQVRLFSDTYIIMLTARADELDTLMGLETGADDYLTKPFRPRELRARVAAMLRRPRQLGGPQANDGGSQLGGDSTAGNGVNSTGGLQLPGAGGTNHDGGTQAAGSGRYEHRGLVLDSLARSVEVDGEDVSLTRTEFELLLALLQGRQTVRTKAELARRIREGEYQTGAYVSESDERVVEVHMGNLRRKLGDDPRDPRWLKTVRGVGYCLAP